ncbi:MAG: TonB-dependent receptor plug domain-containing protein [Saprospiraceae bacterium]|nr:TonB-dependent receptor plug domain-containing protein [Saprospiraceae bacterium]
MSKYSIFLLIVTFVLSSCNSSRDLASANTGPNKIDYTGKRELIDYLRGTAGVEIRGSGTDVLVLIRGVKSITTDNNPLYIVDGVNMGRSYASAAAAANTFEIERVNVLTPPRAGKYGSQGQNGVIEVFVRKTN